MDDWEDPHRVAPQFIVWKNASWERDDSLDGHTFDGIPLVGYRAHRGGEIAALHVEDLPHFGRLYAAANKYISACRHPSLDDPEKLPRLDLDEARGVHVLLNEEDERPPPGGWPPHEEI